jgi:hypothetical protein
VAVYYNLQRNGSDINKGDLQMLDSLVISQKPYLTAGRNKSIRFKCKGYNKEFILSDEDRYCAEQFDILQLLNTGDTISLCLLSDDLPSLHDQGFFAGKNSVHSLVYKNKELIDMSCRNAKARAGLRETMAVCIVMTVMCFFIAFFGAKLSGWGWSIDPLYLLCFLAILTILAIHLLE